MGIIILKKYVGECKKVCQCGGVMKKLGLAEIIISDFIKIRW